LSESDHSRETTGVGCFRRSILATELVTSSSPQGVWTQSGGGWKTITCFGEEDDKAAAKEYGDVPAVKISQRAVVSALQLQIHTTHKYKFIKAHIQKEEREKEQG